MPSTAGLTAAQMSMNGWPTIRTCSELTWAAILLSLEPVYQVVDQHAEPPGRARRESGDDRRQVVDAVQELHDHPGVAKVIAPDLLHQLGVVLALDVDAAGPGDLRPGWRAPRRTLTRSARAARPWSGTGLTSATRLPSSRNVPVSGKTRRLPNRSSSVTASFSQPTTAPQKSPAPSSTTRPRSAGIAGGGTGRREGAASTVSRYLSP